MPLNVLYLGGTGEVSYGCIQAGLALGQQISVFNRGTSGTPLPHGAHHILGDLSDDAAFNTVARKKWDVVCQFRSFDMKQCERDIAAFAGQCGQFVFISTAMVYQRPPLTLPLNESAPRGNPHSPDYAQKKIAIEDRLMQLHHAGKMPTTIVRPSHTVRTRMPGSYISDDEFSYRLLHNQPIICHGDGSSLWALTRTEDFGRAFAHLLGNPAALGQAFHITTDQLHPWDNIYRAWAAAIGAPAPKIIHVSSDTLIKYEPKWASSLHADKAWSIVFDNTKIKSAAPGWHCQHNLDQTLRMSAPHAKTRQSTFKPDPALAKLIDKIIADQSAAAD